MTTDPWPISDSAQVEHSFEDEFVVRKPSIMDSVSELPDSYEYVAGLERKMNHLKKARTTSASMLESVEQKKKDCLIRLLAEEIELCSTQDFELDESIQTKWIRSHINPQQAVTVGELVELVKADYLAKEAEEEARETPGAKESISFQAHNKRGIEKIKASSFTIQSHQLHLNCQFELQISNMKVPKTTWRNMSEQLKQVADMLTGKSSKRVQETKARQPPKGTKSKEENDEKKGSRPKAVLIDPKTGRTGYWPTKPSFRRPTESLHFEMRIAEENYNRIKRTLNALREHRTTLPKQN